MGDSPSPEGADQGASAFEDRLPSSPYSISQLSREVSLSMRRVHSVIFSIVVTMVLTSGVTPIAQDANAQEPPAKLDQLISIALETNPLVRAARERWASTLHQIPQNYAPADPTFSYSSVDSPQFPLFKASAHVVQVTQPLQFPGKALLQGEQAKRSADIARLVYQAALRDLRAQVKIAYYQLALDLALGGVTQEQAAVLTQVVKVTEIAYEGSKASQADFIAAQVALSAATQQVEICRLNVENDATQLNMLLYRRPDEPLVVDHTLDLKPLTVRLDDLIDRATRTRQEVLQAVLAERNSDAASTLAKMEYLPDYSLSYFFDDYLLTSGAPAPNRPQDHSLTLGFNVPIYFWWHQREDVEKSRHDLSAARYDLGSIKNQTAAAVTTLYRTAQVDYRQARLYRDSLVPLARQGYQVALIAYQTGKLDFAGLQIAYQQLYNLQVAYLQFENQFLAQRVALERTVGSPLPQ